MATHRLFVAAIPPARARAALIAAMGGVLGARWQTDEQLHCTLRFIGEVDRHRADDIAAALGGVRHRALTLDFGALGTFDRQGRIDTLWIGIRPRERIASLHGKIDRALVQVGFPPETRAFLPHITLARFARSAAPSADKLRHIAAAPATAFTIERFALVESHLGSDGASYEVIEQYPLHD